MQRVFRKEGRTYLVSGEGVGEGASCANKFMQTKEINYILTATARINPVWRMMIRVGGISNSDEDKVTICRVNTGYAFDNPLDILDTEELLVLQR